MSGWLKAGLIGAVILVLLKVVEVVPCVVCCALPLEWVAFGCIGALAAYWIPPGARTMGAGAGHGALSEEAHTVAFTVLWMEGIPGKS